MNLSTFILSLCLAASTSYAANIQINLTRAGAPTETGFTNWATNDNSLPGNLSVDGLTLSVQASGINAGSTLRSIDRGGNDGYAGALADLTQTWWGQRASSTGSGGYITINISGLAAGDYSFASWHLDQEDQTGQMKIEFSDNGGGSFTDMTAFDLVNYAGGGSAPAENATGPVETGFNFTSTGADVQFRFTNTDVDGVNSSGAFALVNGFSVNEVPEPSSVALIGLAGGVFVLRRRR